MNKRQHVRLEMFRRVEAFLVEQQNAVPKLTASNSRAEFARAVARLEQHAVDQKTARTRAKSGTRAKVALREELRLGAMAPIIELANSRLVSLPDIAAIALPPMRERDSVLISTAEALAEVAEPYQDILDRHLYPRCVDILREATLALRAGIVHRDGARTHEAMSTDAVAVDMDEAHRRLAVLRTLLRREVGSRSPLVAGFEAAARVHALPVKASAPVALRPAISVTARVIERAPDDAAAPRVLSAPVMDAPRFGLLRRLLARVPMRLSA